MAGKRPWVEHTEDFQELLPLCLWPEQVEYERIRQPVLFGDPVAARRADRRLGVDAPAQDRALRG